MRLFFTGKSKWAEAGRILTNQIVASARYDITILFYLQNSITSHVIHPIQLSSSANNDRISVQAHNISYHLDSWPLPKHYCVAGLNP